LAGDDPDGLVAVDAQDFKAALQLEEPYWRAYVIRRFDRIDHQFRVISWKMLTLTGGVGFLLAWLLRLYGILP